MLLPLSMLVLEILHGPFVFLGRLTRIQRAEVLGVARRSEPARVIGPQVVAPAVIWRGFLPSASIVQIAGPSPVLPGRM